eukprot:CAMPEP_0197232802 /NCGR_PEP_ID=MMETSP1429-20130617/1041_1 /TAXON_ID=49237 /ORGANISM="Chaetoceros  sp., Strain UNC1202" /LENGTH=251 /DNA_ID=CAMNT_0042690937 /DNA_START=99 /DNA_END=854 /DNA_ORIENTATION=-
MASAGAAIKSLAVESPHVDVIRYEHKNLKFTLKHVDYHAEAFANGLLESGLAPGDVVLSWLPLHFAEQHILQFACSKAGFVLYNLDPSLATTNPDAAKTALAKALEITEANALIFQEAGDDVNYIRLVEGVIPETRIFNFDDGMHFITPRFPHLRLPIHTGFEYADRSGMIPLYDILSPSGSDNLETSLDGAVLDGNTPLRGELMVGSDGIPTGKGKVMSNDEVVKSGAWTEFASILKKEYSEVEGVGVVF